MKNPEYMASDQLTIELIKGQKRQTRAQVAGIVINLVILAALCVGMLRFIPPAIDTMSDMRSALAEVGELSSQAEISMKKADALMEDADKLLDDNGSNIADIMEKINAIDFDKLNQSIQRLSDVLEPLARLFGNRG